jgi:hypothetical protein
LLYFEEAIATRPQRPCTLGTTHLADTARRLLTERADRIFLPLPKLRQI